jgi:hypothetical protein
VLCVNRIDLFVQEREHEGMKARKHENTRTRGHESTKRLGAELCDLAFVRILCDLYFLSEPTNHAMHWAAAEVIDFKSFLEITYIKATPENRGGFLI